MNNKFKEKYGPWAVITGASDGIGREMARVCAEGGVNVVLIARRKARLQELAQELQRLHSVQTRVLSMDLASEESNYRILEETDDLEVGLLISAAGFGSGGPFLSTDVSSEVKMIRVNCTSSLILSRLFAERMKNRERGGIVLMSSLVAFQGVPGSANYAATKAYIQSLAEALHIELGKHGIDVIASAPGPIASGFAKRAKMQMSQSQTPDVVATATLEALGSRATIRPGWLAKFLESSLSTAPRSLRVRIMGKVMDGMTARIQNEGSKSPIAPD